MNKRQWKKYQATEARRIYYLMMFPMVPVIPLYFMVPKYSDRKAIIKAWKKVYQ